MQFGQSSPEIDLHCTDASSDVSLGVQGGSTHLAPTHRGWGTHGCWGLLVSFLLPHVLGGLVSPVSLSHRDGFNPWVVQGGMGGPGVPGVGSQGGS